MEAPMALDTLDGKRTVVLGGGNGIGRGICLALADHGAKVLVADLAGDAAESVRDEITGKGGEAHAVRVDATDDGSLRAAAAVAEDAFGAVDAFVHTVGIISDSPVIDSPDSVWAWHFELNVLAAVRGVQVFLPLLLQSSGGGHIVITASTAGLLSYPPELTGGKNVGVYTVLKHATYGYGDALRNELKGSGIDVSVLCPGIVRTDLDRNSARNRPKRFGGPAEPSAEVSIAQRMDPEHAGRIAVRGILANRRDIFTHPTSVDLVRQGRMEPQLADFDYWAQNLGD
jgi:NAD(P)-dependent dehydrogenase (short-subunit alcohol dehydrogenase family)